MALSPGTKLGQYEIVGLIGAGGMGEVYRARDSKLKRDVAIKALPDEFSRDHDRLIRFQREAEVLASLNHSNIASIYDLQEANESCFLIMELVDGETLADRINRGRIPIKETLEIAKQIAEALEVAHEKGIIHRDLKPANVKITPDGKVKVLDFGLAKAYREQPETTLSNSPTISMAATNAGVILGSASYMSPEQAKGRQLDRRTDIFAFAAVLYEMLTGKRAFAGEDVADILGAILKTEPDWRQLPTDTPSSIRRLLRRALNKDPRQRLSDMRDARLEIEDAFSDPTNGIRAARRPASTALIAVAASVIAVVIAVIIMAWWLSSPAANDSDPRALQIASGEAISTPQIAPDGHAVVYVRNGKLAIRELASVDTRELNGTDGASNPFWSPDSESIAYLGTFNGVTELRVISSKGGANRTIASDVFAPYGGTWGPTGLIFVRWNRGLWLGSDAAQPRQIASVDLPNEQNLAYPYALADGRILATVYRDNNPKLKDRDLSSLVIIDGTQRTTLFELHGETIKWPVFVAPDSILFVRGGNNGGIWRLPVRKNLSSATGTPVRIVAGDLYPSVSKDGSLVSLSGERTPDGGILVVDRSGKIGQSLGKAPARFKLPAISPDGMRVALGVNAAATAQFNSEIWIHNEIAGQRLTASTTVSSDPAWSPSGDRIAYVSRNPDGSSGLYVQPSSNAGTREAVLQTKLLIQSPQWTRDGKSLIYASGNDQDGLDLRLVTIGESATHLLVKDAQEPAISPDGRLLAYVTPTYRNSSGDSLKQEVFVTTLPMPVGVWPVSNDSGRYPRWSPRGDELFFTNGPAVGGDPNSRRYLSVVKINTQNPQRIGKPQQLLDSLALNVNLANSGSRSYDVFPDGQRFIVQSLGGITPTVNIIQNVHSWMARTH